MVVTLNDSSTVEEQTAAGGGQSYFIHEPFEAWAAIGVEPTFSEGCYPASPVSPPKPYPNKKTNCHQMNTPPLSGRVFNKLFCETQTIRQRTTLA